MTGRFVSKSASQTRVFISFDYDHDDDVRVLLLGQAKHEKTPFAFENWSIKRETRDWMEDARKRIKRSDVVIVICGLHTHAAVGVSAELEIAREEGVRFYLLRGRKSGEVRKPRGTSFLDPIYDWSWDNIEAMCNRTLRPSWVKLW